ncbi:MAG: collagen-like protein, partial [Thermoguttaceae bacterium]|nr:collagen-like protein [Thermoguttaceae bacterium]
MAKDLSRRELREIVAAYKGGELGGSRGGRFVGGVSSEAVVRNATGALLRSGTPVKISGFAQSLTFDAALLRLLNNKLTLRAVAASSDDAPETVGSTLEPIRADGLGRVKLDGLSAARVTFPDGGDDYEYASATFVAAESGPFRILAKSKLSAERVAVCALAKVAGNVEAETEKEPGIWGGVQISVAKEQISGAIKNVVNWRGGLIWNGSAFWPLTLDENYRKASWIKLDDPEPGVDYGEAVTVALDDTLVASWLELEGDDAIDSLGRPIASPVAALRVAPEYTQNRVFIVPAPNGNTMILDDNAYNGKYVYQRKIETSDFITGLRLPRSLGGYRGLESYEGGLNDTINNDAVIWDIYWKGFRFRSPTNFGWVLGKRFDCDWDFLRLEYCLEPDADGVADSYDRVCKIHWKGFRIRTGSASEYLATGVAAGEGIKISYADNTATFSVSLSDEQKEALKGDKGDQGEPGEPGADGKDGVDGKDFTFEDFTPEQLEALKGEKGDKGDPGEPGKDGEKGEKGDPGAKGEKGDPGEKGADGQDGATGPQGPPGPAGADGKDGVDGTNGVDGKDFTFDMFTPEQLEGLKGEPGKDGEDGKDADWSTLHIGDAVRKPKLRKSVATGVVDDAPLLSELGDPSTVDVVSYVGEFSESDAIAGYESPPTAKFLKTLTLAEKTVITGATLGLSEMASTGAVA